MPQVTVVYWRDIPAQVIVGQGRKCARRQLSERFELAIDRAALLAGKLDTDDYLAEWHKTPPFEVAGEATAIAANEAERIETEFGEDRLKLLIMNGGKA